ncbi:TIGR01841 family phasin [Novosphingobium sp. ERN07]|uniref:phasin family protein n=1 Tax=Novosphingobium sp. ERN07 TaxID=2726187 RepID=UPI0014577DF2|nr:phasin family protein [Novosphingobium sp. ERN07]NLR73084.1 TIGR01841 family phasin [Novosphingobium sp. ERN07]
MVEETKDGLAETTLKVDEAVPAPEVPAVATKEPAQPPLQSAVEEAAMPVKSPKAKVAAVKAPAAETPVAETAAVSVKPEAVAKSTKAKPVRKIAEKPVTKARRAQPPVAAAPAPAVKPASKRPFTATPSVKQISAAPKATTAPKKELFAMATTTEMTEKMSAAFKDAQEKAKAALEKGQAAFGDAGEFAKGNVEAVVESSKIFASGLQEMTKGYVAETKSVFETMTADVKDLTTVKSPTEFFEKQSALMRKNFDAAVAASSKNSEALLKLANEAFQPISTRVSLAVEKMKQAA